jgi:hypothetical protein
MKRSTAILLAALMLFAASPAFAEVFARSYGFRGLLGGALAYSWGIDELQAKVKAHGAAVYVKPWYRASELYATIKANYARDRKPVILIGHSMGADRLSRIAHWAQKDGIPIAAAFYVDPTPAVWCVPSNVQVAIGFRRTAFGNLGGGRIAWCVEPGAKDTRSMERYDIPTTHVNVDDHPFVHRTVLKHADDVMHMIWEKNGRKGPPPGGS